MPQTRIKLPAGGGAHGREGLGQALRLDGIVSAVEDDAWALLDDLPSPGHAQTAEGAPDVVDGHVAAGRLRERERRRDREGGVATLVRARHGHADAIDAAGRTGDIEAVAVVAQAYLVAEAPEA